jgi:hypothetical protein
MAATVQTMDDEHQVPDDLGGDIAKLYKSAKGLDEGQMKMLLEMCRAYQSSKSGEKHKLGKELLDLMNRLVGEGNSRLSYSLAKEVPNHHIVYILCGPEASVAEGSVTGLRFGFGADAPLQIGATGSLIPRNTATAAVSLSLNETEVDSTKRECGENVTLYSVQGMPGSDALQSVRPGATHVLMATGESPSTFVDKMRQCADADGVVHWNAASRSMCPPDATNATPISLTQAVRSEASFSSMRTLSERKAKAAITQTLMAAGVSVPAVIHASITDTYSIADDAVEFSAGTRETSANGDHLVRVGDSVMAYSSAAISRSSIKAFPHQVSTAIAAADAVASAHLVRV